MKNKIKFIKNAGTWSLKYGENFASLGVGYNAATGGTPTVKRLKQDFPDRIERTTELLLREGTQSPYLFGKTKLLAQ